MIYDFIEKVVRAIMSIFDDSSMSRDDKENAVREKVSNALFHIKLTSFSREDDED